MNNTTKLIIVLLIIILAVIILTTKTIKSTKMISDTDGGFVTLEDLPALTDSLMKSKESSSFFVILIPGTANQDRLNANIQYSIENNSIGIDWVLIANRNIKDKDKFIEITSSFGLNCEQLSKNDVEYIRATGKGNLSIIGRQVIEKMYSVKADLKMQLIITGFTWK